MKWLLLLLAAFLALASTPAVGQVPASIAITRDATALIVGGGTSQATCTETYSDGSTADCTTRAAWSSPQTTIFTVAANTGIITPVAAGYIDVKAKVDNLHGTLPVKVSPSTQGTTAQTITFSGTQGCLQARAYGSAGLGCSATSTSGLGITFTTSGACEMGSSTILNTLNGAGTCTVTANQVGNATYAAAAPVSYSFAVSKAPLTITAVQNAFHVGDPLPPLIYVPAGFVNSDTDYTAVAGNPPVLSTTATAASAVGDYPITIGPAASNPWTSANYTLSYVNGTMHVRAFDKTGARFKTATAPANAFSNATYAGTIKDQGAKGDGLTDDTAAINAVLNTGRGYSSGTTCADFTRNPRMYRWPAGTYLVSDTLTWTCGAEMLWWFDPGVTIKLAPRTPKFNTGTPRPVLYFKSASTATAYGNIAFRNFIFGSTPKVEIGEGNVWAEGISYTGSNEARIAAMQVVSDDSLAYAGFNFTDNSNGPEYNQNISAYGFKYGINLGQPQYSSTYSHVTLIGQTGAAIYSPAAQAIGLEYVYSCNAVPLLTNGGAPINLLNSMADCGTSTAAAVTNGTQGLMHVAALTVQGYTTSISDSVTLTNTSGNIAEYVSGPTGAAFTNAQHIPLNLPNDEAPDPSDPNPSTWIQLSTTDGTQWASQMATCTSTTAYLPAGQYNLITSTTNILIPDCIQHIHLFGSGEGTVAVSQRLIFNVASSSSTTPLLIEAMGNNTDVTYLSGQHRPVIMRDFGGTFVNNGVGKTWADDFIPGAPFTINAGDQFIARQLDVENATVAAYGAPCTGGFSGNSCYPPSGVKITQNGPSTLWALIYKTEKGSTNLVMTNGAQAQIEGGWHLTLQANQQPTSTTYQVSNSQLSVKPFREYLYNSGTATTNSGTAHLLQDTQQGVTQYLDPANQNTSASYGELYSSPSATPLPATRSTGKHIRSGTTVSH